MTEHEPGQEGRGPDDRELEDFLAGRGPLSRAHREGAPEQAPPGLDAKVLAAAREELRRAVPRRHLLRWDGPLALAASMLLVVSLGWLVQRQVPRPGPAEAELAPAAAPPAPAPAVEAPAAQNSAASIAPPAQPPPPQLREDKPAAGEKAAREPAPSPAVPRKAMPPPAAENPATGFVPDAPPAPVAIAPPPPAPAAAAGMADKPSAMLAPQARDRMEQPEQALKKESAGANAGQAVAPPAAMASDSAAKSLAPAASPMRTNDSALQADPCASPRRPAHPHQDPDAPAWLDRIRALRTTDAAAARAELACFVAHQPQAEVPDDLKALLPEQR